MNKIAKKYSLLLLALGFGSLLSCNRKKKECDGKTGLYFNFDIPYTITPMHDTFSTGDTIWMEFYFSNQLYNKANSKTYTVNNFEFKMYSDISDLFTNTVRPTNAFTMLNSLGFIDSTEDRHGALFHINTQMEGNIYTWKAGFILHKKGLYAFAPGSEIGNDGILAGQSPAQQITQCPNEGMSLDFILSNGEGNSYFLNDAADENPRERWDRASFDKACFAFYVKE